MAGAGFRDWSPGDVPTADQFDTYLQQQVVGVYADAADRDAQLSIVKAEGMVAYLKDTNRLTVYTGSAWLHLGGYTDGVLRFATAAARDAAMSAILAEGKLAYLLDTNQLTVYFGSGWTSLVSTAHGAWTDWGPGVTQSAGVAVTNSKSRYQRVGRMVTADFELSVTGAGNASQPVLVSLPFTAVFVGDKECGTGHIYDSSTGSKFPALIALVSSTALAFYSTATNSADLRLGVTSFTAALASGDQLAGTFAFEAAAD